MFALIDCNNFFVSCERSRRPELASRPVIVLSNNDGCAVALSNEAKALGIRRGVPLFQIKDLVQRYGIVIISGDHHFYSACSRRVMAVLRSFDLPLEVYSIDEAFLHLPPDLGDPPGFGRYVADMVRTSCSIPVGIGIAATKTLAKIAARFAKKYPGYRGCCMIGNEAQRRRALELTDTADVWGIGRRLAPRLHLMGITNAAEYADLEREVVRARFGVNGERTWRELRGEPCVDSVNDQANKTILSSRSFERDIFTFAELRQALCVFADIVGEKLRAQHSYAAELGIFIATNRFHTRSPQYSNSVQTTLPLPTAYTPALAAAATALLERIFRPGYGYKRAGIIVPRIVPGGAYQPSLFEDPARRERRARLMRAVDALNAQSPGTPAIRIAAIGDGLTSLVRKDNANF